MELQHFSQIHRLIRWSAAAIGLFIAIGVPAFYAYLDYSRLQREVSLSASILASDLGKFIKVASRGIELIQQGSSLSQTIGGDVTFQGECGAA